MYCIFVAGIPASGKSTMAAFLGEQLGLPVLSKDSVKELLFDTLGFRSRAEKVRLGDAAARMLCYAAEQLMRAGQPFLLENNFEDRTREDFLSLLARYRYTGITVALTGDYRAVYRRFAAREQDPGLHRVRSHLAAGGIFHDRQHPCTCP